VATSIELLGTFARGSPHVDLSSQLQQKNNMTAAVFIFDHEKARQNLPGFSLLINE